MASPLLLLANLEVPDGGSMFEVGLVALSVALVAVGIKGFTPSGLTLSKHLTITGVRSMLLGSLCMLLGMSLMVLLLTVVWLVDHP